MTRDDSRAGTDQSPRIADRPRTLRWLTAYVVSGVVLAIVLKIVGPEQLETGRFFDSLPVPILLLAAGAAAGLVIALRRAGEPWAAWLAFIPLSLFLVGEEVKWGHEPVFGLQLSSGDGWDLHNRFAFRYLREYSPIDHESAAGVAIVSIIGALLVVGVALFGARRIAARRVGLPGIFLLIAVTIALFSLILDVLDLATEQFFLNRTGVVKWAAEEASEIMASLALTCAPLARLTSLRARERGEIRQR